MAKPKGMTPLVCLHTIYGLTEQVPLTVKDRARVEAMRNVVHEFIEQAQKPAKKKAGKKKAAQDSVSAGQRTLRKR